MQIFEEFFTKTCKNDYSPDICGSDSEKSAGKNLLLKNTGGGLKSVKAFAFEIFAETELRHSS